MLFWFWSADLFKYEHTYHLKLSSLPASYYRLLFPANISLSCLDGLPATNLNDLPCSESGHKDAHRWVTAFRLVHKKPWQRAIDVEFIAAPSAYCFEAYELRLIHESKNIVQSTVVSTDSLTRETIDNRFVAYGKYSFENVEPGNYRIGLIPVDRGRNGICRCPVPDGSCSCSLAVLHNVVMLGKKKQIIVRGLRRYILPSVAETLPCSSKEELVQVNKETNLLLIYARDCPLHENAVHSLAAWLQWIWPSVRISADFLCKSDILENKCDWVVKSIKEADRIIVINSYGSFMRYRAKLLNEQTVGLIERKSPDEFDFLFLTQIDLIFSQFFSKLMSVRFSYTPSEWILPPLTAYPCYELPTHRIYFVENLFHPSSKASVATKQFSEGIFYDQFCRLVDEGLKEFAHSNDWFSKWHCRKRCTLHFSPIASRSSSGSTAARDENPESVSLLLSSDSHGTTFKEEEDINATVEKAVCEGPTGDSGFEDGSAKSLDRYTSTKSFSQHTATDAE
ncbi:SEFIR domain containing protein [Trichuris trichiura]|uniref:SEFIR domain containing protein n=1 Tax=Trichuris trichiura TaxID=36087 RepID=A0A077Z6J4_TRITR|nr:SEFIR domain containing protein [Trichuris trichiura]